MDFAAAIRCVANPRNNSRINCRRPWMYSESQSIAMKMTRPAFVLGGLLCCLLFLSIDTAYSQTPAPRSYFFVEVKDTAGQVVADATVTVSADGKLITSETTDKNGFAHPNFPPRSDHHYDVRISKDGYVPSEHVYFPSRYGTILSEGMPNYFKSPESPVIVLRKPPTTPADRQAAEVEEQKYQLLLAAKRGDPANLHKLLQAGVKADTEDANVVLAITWAAFAGDAETIKLLLAAGADVGNKNAQGHQALLTYLDEGIPRQNRTRKPGNDSNAGSEKDWRELCEEAVLKLVEAGAGVNVHNSYGANVLNRALVQIPGSLSSKTIKVLIAAGANVNDADDSEGWTPLMFAAQTGSAETIRILCGLAPALSFTGWWDQYLSAALYSGKSPVGVMHISESLRERLPATAEQQVFTTKSGELMLPFYEWSMAELNVPPYPEVRVYRHLAKQVCLYSDGQQGIELIVKDRISLINGSFVVTRTDYSGL